MKIAIASGKGGTGKTFVAVNLFLTLQKMKKETALVDCDAEVPNALAFFSSDKKAETDITEFRPVIDKDKCIFCKKCMEYCSYHAITCIPSKHYIQVSYDFCHGCTACSVACTHQAITESTELIGKITVFSFHKNICLAEGRLITGRPSPVPVIKAAMGNIFEKEFQYTLYDSPPGTSCPFIQTVSQADYTLLVTEPTPFGLSDLKQAVSILEKMKKPFGVIINRAGLGNNDVYRYLKANNLSLLAQIPFDEKIAQLYSEGKIVSEYIPQAKKTFRKLAEKIISNGNSGNQR